MKRLQYSADQLRQMWNFTRSVPDPFARNSTPGQFERFLDLLQWLDTLDDPSLNEQLESLRVIYQPPTLPTFDEQVEVYRRAIGSTRNSASPDSTKEPEGPK